MRTATAIPGVLVQFEFEFILVYRLSAIRMFRRNPAELAVRQAGSPIQSARLHYREALRNGVFTPGEISEGLFAQAVFLGSKVDADANCFHKRSSSLLMRGGTWMETTR